MNVLFAVDLSEQTLCILEHALPTLRLVRKVYLVHVSEPEPEFVGYDSGPKIVRDQKARQLRQQHQSLQVYATTLRKHGIAVKAILLQGATRDSILDKAERLNVGMIVIGTHGRSAILDTVMGSVGLGVMKNASIPVLLIPVRKCSTEGLLFMK